MVGGEIRVKRRQADAKQGSDLRVQSSSSAGKILAWLSS